MPEPRSIDGRRAAGWDDEAESAPVQALTRQQALELLAKQRRAVSPWRVVAVQLATGLVLATIAALVLGRKDWGWSVLYGSACVFVPAALMARGMSRRVDRVPAGLVAMSFMVWEFGKLGLSAAMLALAPRFVSHLSWPALLVGLVLCIKVYWLALLWRRGPPA